MSNALTYRQLKLALDELPEHWLDASVTLFDVSSNQMYIANDTLIGSELPTEEARDEFFTCLDEDQPIITFNQEEEED